mmetsp:Transcript_20460/g.44412  ORF Transcript_20460/g.44412 Transcript_20460/m.44412 type:complete len:490 (-) Transcript_20460:109-1578(-)|eukprot:CAMPEP_0172321442 /NCGR_PEP_ID=MMETSP1058-20130122/43437_1 /TAXON_ID=83371 /ORGANISM="Detonula confervacea, Strain CCMP 353" /LENGTH=489 /DNA_ID=CAMNT_0013036955 /DNA_START=67 /DNA_END=1536 /DNA_ORIENTATION=-
MPAQRRNTAHEVFLQFHRHRAQSLKDLKEDDGADEKKKTIPSPTQPFEMFHTVMKTGVIYASSRAQKHGFTMEDPEWANMGQGAPETGPLPGAPSRDFHMNIQDAELEYAPTAGITELREKVANYYNELYRKGKESKYSYENICVVPGGRAGLTRIMAALGSVQVGYFTPDYTAYQQALGLFMRITPSPLLHRNMHEAIMSSEDFRFEAGGRGLGAMLLSNPSNPTGQSLEGEELENYVKIARELGTALLMDEFYSHYYYDGKAVDPEDGGVDDETNWPKTVSSATYVEDVNTDPVIIVNGLTKNWRCPGFRVCWIVAPKTICEMLASAGSFLDGGANAPLQKLALPLMDMDFIRRDTWALQRHFKKKRDFLLRELSALGITVQWTPTATFYIWADLSGLPHPLNDCLVFLEECVKHKVICVPGVFFDINPRDIRNIRTSKCLSFVRFSYGPHMENLEKGMQQIRKMIDYWKCHSESPGKYDEEESFGD